MLTYTRISSVSSKINEARFDIMYGRIPFLEPRKGTTRGKGNLLQWLGVEKLVNYKLDEESSRVYMNKYTCQSC